MSLIESENYTYRVTPGVLRGEVTVSGAKNSALRLLAASILTDETLTLNNYPHTLLDAVIHVEMLEVLGKTTQVLTDHISISGRVTQARLQWDGRSIRNTLLILGALLAKNGEGRVPVPGGCKLGDRKHDLHELVFRTLGAEVWVEEDYFLCAKSTGRLKGAEIHLPLRSTGATENALLCGSLAEGKTVLWNPHIKPEILDLVEMLNAMGARITVFGQERIEIIGVDSLQGTTHSVIPDNVEALTWLVGAATTGGHVRIKNFPVDQLEVPLIYLRESGAIFSYQEGVMDVRGGTCYPLEFSTGSYPGINSDMQPILALFGAVAKGETRITDLRFPGRYAYAAELGKMGLKSAVDGNTLRITGGTPFIGTTVKAVDLRGGVAVFLAGLLANGETTIEDAFQIDRGYCRFVEKARSLGVSVTKLGR